MHSILSKRNSFGRFLCGQSKRAWLFIVSALTLLSPMQVSASESASIENAWWNTTMDFLLVWIPRLGGVLLFIGAIEFAVAYKNEDSNSKTNATRLMISGAMVIGVCFALRGIIKIP